MSVRLDSVCDIIMGQAPAGDEYNVQGDGLPLLAGAGDFKDGRPAAKKFTRVVTMECVPGDLVIGIRASIGDKVIADRPYCLGRVEHSGHQSPVAAHPRSAIRRVVAGRLGRKVGASSIAASQSCPADRSSPG